MVPVCVKIVAAVVGVLVAASTFVIAQEIIPSVGFDHAGRAETVINDKAPATAKKSDADTSGGARPAGPNAEAVLAYNQGLSDAKRQDFKKAIEQFDKAIAVAPDYGAAYAERGGARIGLGLNDLAIVDLTKALDLARNSVAKDERSRLYGNRGLAYLNQAKYDLAVTDFTKAIEINPTMAFAYANRGMAQLQRKSIDAALQDASRAIELRAKYDFAYLVRGFVLSEKGAFKDAALDFLQVLSLVPDNRGAILGLRQAYLTGKEQEDGAKIRLVRLADPACEPSCAEWIAIKGRIDTGAADALKEVLREAGKRKLPILVDSGGGAVNEAMEMGRLIRARGLDVVVARTEFVTCSKDDAVCRKRVGNGHTLGMVRSAGAICASSCGFLLASGVHRSVGASTLVGVHQIVSFQTYQKVYRQYEVQRAYRGGRIVEIDRRVVSETRGATKTVQTATGDETYVKIRKYFSEMGIDDGIMPLLISSPPKGMHWLTDAELKSTALMTDHQQGEQLIARSGVLSVNRDSKIPGAAMPATAISAGDVMKASPGEAAADATALTRSIQTELVRVGCAPGAEDGKWGQGVRRALERYNVLTGKPLKTSSPTPETLAALAARKGLVCPPACPTGMKENDGQCVKQKS